MSTVHEDTKVWLLSQQDWLQEAAARLLNSGQLQDADLKATAELLKTQDGRKATKHRAFTSLTQAPAASGELRLFGISEIEGIENLSPKSPLDFGKGNLVVVYGHNGSGKSGYTRILKRASGKPRSAALKTNVFGDPPKFRQCKIDYQQGASPASLVWAADGDAVPDLRVVDIFDSEEAVHYLTKESSAGYVPPLVLMFEQLAAACDGIKAKLQTQQDKLVSALPELPQEYAGTGPAGPYTKLRHTMTQADIDQLTIWTEAQAKTLQDLTNRLKVADPAAGATQRRTKRAQVEIVIASLGQGTAAFGAVGIQSIRTLHTAAKDKRRIASEAATVSSALLDGVGQATWRAMWDAARDYSQTAYPKKQFPVTDKARCLLCHQELQPDAQQRLQDFEAFVGSKLEAEAKSAEQAHADAIAVSPMPPTDEQLTTQCAASGLEETAWLEDLKEFWASARLTRAALLAMEANGAAAPVPDAAPLVARLRARSKSLEEEALQLDKDAKEFDRAKAAKDKLALEAEKWISQQKAAVTKEVERLKAWHDFETWKGLANSRRVSMKASEVTEKVITEAYVNRFNAELEALGAKRVRVSIVKTRIERGKAMHQLKLTGAKSGDDPAGVLSEGERRIVSLAAFLADVTAKPYVAPLVFDDPISSLDHDFEWAVAKRLAELAKTRQVLVFTHRLSLYGAMEDVAKKNGEKWRDAHLVRRCIEAFAGAAGRPVADTIWMSGTVKANNMLLDQLQVAKKVGEAGGGDAYRALAQAICSDFRKLLERTVEDDLLSAVVKRHRRSVTTDNKLLGLSAIEPDDCKFIDGLMTKYSFYEHSQSTETPAFIPDEPELRQDVESLKAWRTGFDARCKKALG
jgi:energy-coupling factor transporter ATP-binding protein EcfA2